MSETVHLGSELLRDSCPKSHYSAASIISSILPGLIIYVLVAIFAGSLMTPSLPLPAVVAIMVALLALLGGVMFSMFKKLAKRLSETYISVCEDGITGIVCLGQVNSTFCVRHEEISAVITGKDRIVITVPNGTLNLIVHEPEKLADLIREKAEL